jgi:hypothetical protein
MSDENISVRDMSLRDWFAGMALAGWLAAHVGDDIPHPVDSGTAPEVAADAYRMADWMIEMRKVKFVREKA